MQVKRNVLNLRPPPPRILLSASLYRTHSDASNPLLMNLLNGPPAALFIRQHTTLPTPTENAQRIPAAATFINWPMKVQKVNFLGEPTLSRPRRTLENSHAPEQEPACALHLGGRGGRSRPRGPGGSPRRHPRPASGEPSTGAAGAGAHQAWLRPPGPPLRRRGAPTGAPQRRAAPSAGHVRSGAGAETAAARCQRAGEEEDARPQHRLRPAPERHPEPGERQEAVQVRDAADGADLHRHAQRAAPGGPLRSDGSPAGSAALGGPRVFTGVHSCDGERRSDGGAAEELQRGHVAEDKWDEVTQS